MTTGHLMVIPVEEGGGGVEPLMHQHLHHLGNRVHCDTPLLRQDVRHIQQAHTWHTGRRAVHHPVLSMRLSCYRFRTSVFLGKSICFSRR